MKLCFSHFELTEVFQEENDESFGGMFEEKNCPGVRERKTEIV